MKIKVLGNELIDADIEFVSLVKRGANRSPFKIIKAEDLKNVDETVNKDVPWWKNAAFLLKNDQNDEKPDEKVGISAIFVQKDSLERVVPVLKEAGFEVDPDNLEMEEDVVMFKMDGFTGVGNMIALSPEVGIATDTVIKEFTPWINSTDFNDNLGSAFFPGFGMAIEALHETVYNILSAASGPEGAQEDIKKAVGSFQKYVNKLSKSLPSAVFKLEKALEFESSTIKDSDISPSQEEENMSVIKEVVPGDLDGLNEEVEKQEEEVLEAAPADNDGIEKQDEIEVKVGSRKVMRNNVIVDQEYTYTLDEDGNEVFLAAKEEEEEAPAVEAEEVEKEEEPAEVEAEAEAEVEKEEAPAEEPVIEAAPEEDKLSKLVDAISALTELVKTQGERIEEVSKAADEAQETASRTVVVDSLDDVDESLGIHSMGTARQIRKGEATGEDVWGGILNDFDR